MITRELDLSNRSVRFCSHEVLKEASFQDSDRNGNYRGFAWQWFAEQHYEENLPKFVEAAAEGIFIEGKIFGNAITADRLKKDLLQVKYGSRKQIALCSVLIYTEESFLYRLVNRILRTNDLTKLQTLGPFCYLLKYIGLLHLFPDHIYEHVVYRAADLSEEEIEQYRLAIDVDHPKQWLAFTSTTKNRQLALFYQRNTLFEIQLPIHEYSFGIDISTYSAFPDEEEVLLPTQICFRVKNVEYNREDRVHVIHLDMNVLKKD